MEGLSVLSLSAANLRSGASPRNSRNVIVEQAAEAFRSAPKSLSRGQEKEHKAFRDFVRNEFTAVTTRITAEFEQALQKATKKVHSLETEVALLRQQLTQASRGSFSFGNDRGRESRASHTSRTSRTSLMVPSAASSRRTSRNRMRGSGCSRGSHGAPVKGILSNRSSQNSTFSSTSSVSSAASFHSAADEKPNVPPDIQLARVPSPIDNEESDSNEDLKGKASKAERSSGRLFNSFKSSQIIARLRVGLGGVAASGASRLKVPAKLLSGGVRSNSINNGTNPVSVAIVPTDDDVGVSSISSNSMAVANINSLSSGNTMAAVKDNSMASNATAMNAVNGVKDPVRTSVESGESTDQADRGPQEDGVDSGALERPPPVISSPAPPPLEPVPGMANAPDGCAPVLAFNSSAPSVEGPRPAISVRYSEPAVSRSNQQAWQATERATTVGAQSLQDPPALMEQHNDGVRLSTASGISAISRSSDYGGAISHAASMASIAGMSHSSDIGELPLFGHESSFRDGSFHGSFISSSSMHSIDKHAEGHCDKKRVVFFGHQETTASVASQFSELPGMGDGCFHVLPVWFSSHHRMESVGTPRLTFQADDDSESEDEEHHDTVGHIMKRCTACCQMFMIHPSSSWRMAWDLLGAFLVTYECIMIPLQFLNLEETKALVVIAWLLRIYWTSDIPCSMCTGFHYPEGKAEMRPRKVMKNYFRTWFLFDFVMVSIDWIEVFMRGLSGLSAARMGKNLKGLRMLRMVRLWRLLRLKSMPNVLKNVMEAYFRSEVASIVIAILKIMLFICWLNHVIACCWYGLAYADDTEHNWLTSHMSYSSSIAYHYWSAFHWSLSGFTGNMEVFPHNTGERVFSVLVLLLIYVISASVVSSITSLMTRLEIATALEARKFHSLKQYLLDNHISARVALRVTRNAQYALSEQKKNTPESSIELLGLISDPLRVELHFEINMPVLGHHPFFRNYALYAPGMMRQVCHLGIGILSLSRGDVVFSEGEVTSFPSMFFLLDGRLNYSHRLGDVVELKPPDWFSEAILWTPWMHCGVMRAKSECRCKVLEAETFANVCTTWASSIRYAQKYGKSFVHHLNNHPRGALYLTDIDDPDMDVEWSANKALPKDSQIRHSHGRLHNLIQTKSRSSVFSRDSNSPSNRISFMGKAFSINPFRRHSHAQEAEGIGARISRSRSPPLGGRGRVTPPPGSSSSRKTPAATPEPKAERICIASEIADPDRPARQARVVKTAS